MAADTRSLFGLRIDAVTLAAVVEQCETAIQSRRRTLIGVVNAAKIVRIGQDERLRDSLLECDVLLADGQSVVWASRLLRKALPERVTGIDLFVELLHLADRQHRSVYLLGAKPEVLAQLQVYLADCFPGLILAGAQDGYFVDEDSASVAAAIRQSGADMLFLGMTTPKKEIFLGQYGDFVDVPVLHGVGGSFDVLAGVTKRAPLTWQRFGLEWAYRLLQEPRRLWRRYLSTNSAFVGLTIKELVRPTKTYRLSRLGR
jgi:N-acetylglucosaminyldiphosphoundecaprenol N-acetyl-beta-D-mannosaminyltransferase